VTRVCTIYIPSIPHFMQQTAVSYPAEIPVRHMQHQTLHPSKPRVSSPNPAVPSAARSMDFLWILNVPISRLSSFFVCSVCPDFLCLPQQECTVSRRVLTGGCDKGSGVVLIPPRSSFHCIIDHVVLEWCTAANWAVLRSELIALLFAE